MRCFATVVPARTDSLLAFLALLMKNQDTPGAIKTWERLTQLHEKFETWHLFEYVHYLIQVRRPDAAMSAWEQAADSSWTLRLSTHRRQSGGQWRFQP